MRCKKPFFSGILSYGCGQCLPCRIDRRRLWTHRIMLETTQHERNAFVTLTYDDHHLPANRELCPRDVTLWLKKLRKKVASEWRLRYFLVGEYGDQTERPHYHVALFGFPSCSYGTLSAHKRCRCPACLMIRFSWGKGQVMVGTLTKDSASYVAGYVTKKMTNPKDERLNGRYPEFARMSLNPGIGALAISDICRSLNYDGTGRFVSEVRDVPSVLVHGGKSYPLGRYLKSKMREVVFSVKDDKSRIARLSESRTGTPWVKICEWYVGLRRMFEENKRVAKGAESKDPRLFFMNKSLLKARAVEYRYKIYSKGRSL